MKALWTALLVYSLMFPAITRLSAQGAGSSQSQNVTTNNGLVIQNNVVIKELKEQAVSNHLSPDSYLRILTPAQERSPRSSCEDRMSIPRSALRIYYAQGLSWSSKSQLSLVTAIAPDGAETRLLWVERRGKLLVIGARIFNADGKIIVAMDDSRTHLNLGEIFDVKRPDSHTLEITDTRNETVLRLHFINESSISIEGIFYPPSIDGHATASSPLRVGGKQSFELGHVTIEGMCSGESRNVFAVSYQ